MSDPRFPGAARARCVALSVAATPCPAARGPDSRTTWRASSWCPVKNLKPTVFSQSTFTKERCFKHDQQYYFLVPSITFFLILTGCTLEVWDESDGVDKQVSAERNSANEGFIRNAKDLYNKEKLVLSAEGDANWIEELNDDFNDMNEDISSYRCRCG